MNGQDREQAFLPCPPIDHESAKIRVIVQVHIEDEPGDPIPDSVIGVVIEDDQQVNVRFRIRRTPDNGSKQDNPVYAELRRDPGTHRFQSLTKNRSNWEVVKSVPCHGLLSRQHSFLASARDNFLPLLLT
jgi:hypothetical protein